MTRMFLQAGLRAAGGLLALAVLPLAVAHAAPLKPMPRDLEIRFALSALPPDMRPQATVYALDTATGYKIVQAGQSGVECLVERTAWELGTDRDDIYIPLCYDRSGLKGHFQAIKDAAAMRAHGMDAVAIKAEITRRYQQHAYPVPSRAGLSYMLSPIMRTKSSPDFKVTRDHPDLDVQTGVMPHLMVYASGVSNADIGAAPDMSRPQTLSPVFVDTQGNAEQSYMIVPAAPSERAKIMADEKPLIDALCAYRDVLCLAQGMDAKAMDDHGMN